MLTLYRQQQQMYTQKDRVIKIERQVQKKILRMREHLCVEN